MNKICPNCNMDTVLEGAKSSPSRSKGYKLSMGEYCLMCNYEGWTYVSESFLHNLFSTDIFEDKIAHEEAVKIMNQIESKIKKHGVCRVLKNRSSLKFLDEDTP